MALSDYLTDRLGSARPIELTNFDDASATTVNSTRFSAAIEDAQRAIRRKAGIIAPTDTTGIEYDTYRELVMLGVVYYLEWYRNRHGAETTAAKQAFDQAMGDLRNHTIIPTLTDSVVDVSNQDDVSRPARFAPGHFNRDYRIKSRGTPGSGEDYD